MGDNVNIRTKDSVFCNLFSIPEYQLKLCNTLYPDLKDLTEADLKTLTLSAIMSNGLYNDLGLQVRNRLMVLVEAQSTWSPMVVARIMTYYFTTLNEYFTEHDYNTYGNVKRPFPKPELYVIYSGKRKKKPEYLSFIQEYFPEGCCIEGRIKMIYLDENDPTNNIINQYLKFCRVFDSMIKKYGKTTKAQIETIRICQDADILANYLETRKAEVMGIMNKEFEQERVNKLNMKDAEARGEARGRAEGRAEGEAKGRAEGIAEGEAKGRAEVLFGNLKTLMETMKLSIEEALVALKVPELEHAKYRAMLS